MARLSAIAQTIVNFFCFLWATFVRICVTRDKAASHSQDIESGMPFPDISSAKIEKDIVFDIKRTSIHVHAATVPGDIDLESGTIVYDHPVRKPSRRASAVDPVKSRILDATLKHVQDKTFNVVKTVVIQPPIIAIPCSATIEYYYPEGENPIIPSTKHTTKNEARVVQFALPPVIVDDCVASSDTECTSMTESTSSLGDLLDLFPVPPTYIPEPPSAGAARLNEEPGKNTSRKWSTSPVTAMEDTADADSSDSESAGSSYSTALLSDDTADTSLPSSPASVSALILRGDCAAAKRHVNSDAASNASLDEVTVRAALTAQEYRHDILPALKGKGFAKHTRSPVDDISDADLDGSHAIGEDVSKPKISTQGAPDVLTKSLSGANLFSHLEDSFEPNYEELRRFHRGEDAFFALNTRPDRTPYSFPACKVVPLRIVKKNNPIIVNPFPENSDGPVNCFTVKWERSTESVRKTFKDMDIQDTDFRNLFYSDSPLSQSSLARAMHGLVETSVSCESGTSFSMCRVPNDRVLGVIEQPTELSLSSPDLADFVSTGETHEQALEGPSTPLFNVTEDTLPGSLEIDLHMSL